MESITSILHRIEYPGDFFRFGTVHTRQKYHNLCRVLRRGIYRERRRWGQEIQTTDNIVEIPEEKGFVVRPPDCLDVLQEAVGEARRLFEKADVDQVMATTRKKYLLNLPIQEDLNLQSPLMKLALHPSIMGAVSKYIGMLPVLTQVQLWYSPNTYVEPGGSQFFHLDHADVRQGKLFLFVEDIYEDCGPFTVISAAHSQKVCDAINYRLCNESIRVDDEIIYETIGQSNVHPVVGEAGTMALVDTCRCFHLGSRKASKPRSIIVIQYLSPFAFALPWRWKEGATFRTLVQPNTPELARRVLGAA